MSDVALLKEKIHIQDVIEVESGFMLDRQPGQRYWHALADPDLVVDLQGQRYIWSEKGESGDVLTWLMKRRDWGFRTAVKYLEYLTLTPPEKWPKAPAPSGELEKQTFAGAMEDPHELHKPLDPIVLSDKLVKRILELGRDYPDVNRLTRLVNVGSFMEVLDEGRWMPRVFIPLIGDLRDASDFCGLCDADLLENWQNEGKVYLAAKIGEDYELIAGHEHSGLFCGACVSKIRRWVEALDLLFKYRMKLGGALDEIEEAEDEFERNN